MALTLAANALITIEEFQAYKGDDTERDVNEDRYIWMINAASQAIADYCDRTLCPSTAISNLEWFDGDDTPSYYVRHRYITGTPTLYYYSGLDWTEMTTTSYPRQITGSMGLIYMLQGHIFCAGTRYRVDYTTGYAQASVPIMLKQACCRVVDRAIKVAEGKDGVTSESFGDQTTAFSFNRWPDDLKQMLEPYRKITVG